MWHGQQRKRIYHHLKVWLLDDTPQLSSLRYTKKNEIPKLDPWRTPTETSAEDENWQFRNTLGYLFSEVFRQFWRLVYWFVHPNSGIQKKLKFSFFSCISIKVAISHSTMHLIISKWLKRQKCKKKRKKWDKKMLE